MEQRPLRLGDVVDDYCPRERRITNHAIVAIVGVDIKQTRCSTCEAEHVYKGGKAPRRKKAEPTAFDQVLGEVTGQLARPRGEAEEATPVAAAPAPQPATPVAAAATAPPAAPAPPPVTRVAAAPAAPRPAAPVAASSAASPPAASPAAAPPATTDPDPEPADTDPHRAVDGWLAHRRLIRATLPRTDQEPPARPIPEFTMHQRQGRPGRSGRFGQPWHEPRERNGNVAHGNANGNVAGNGHRHGHGQSTGQPHGRPPVEGNGQPAPGGGDGQPRKGRRRRRRRPRSPQP